MLSYVIDAEQGLLVTLVEGPITLDDVRAVFAAECADPRMVHVKAHIVDGRKGSTSALAFGDVRVFVEDQRRFLAKHPHGESFRTAFVTSRDVDYGVARVYQAMASGEVEVFRDMDAALAWLGMSWPNPQA